MTPEEINNLPYRPNVGVMLLNENGAVFVGQRIDNPGPAWQMPQGGIDKGEDPLDAAFRELEEETGVSRAKAELLAETQDWLTYELPHDLIPKLWKGRYRGQKQKWYLMRFLGQDSDVNIETDPPEFSRWKWLGVDDLEGNIVPFKREVYQSVVTAFRSYL